MIYISVAAQITALVLLVIILYRMHQQQETIKEIQNNLKDIGMFIKVSNHRRKRRR